MPKRRRASLILTDEERLMIERLCRSKKTEQRLAERAQVLRQYSSGERVSAISLSTGLTRKSVGKWIDRALALGVATGLRDAPHGAKAKITPEAKTWVINLACTQPKDLGYAAEVWSRQALADHVRSQAQAAGHASLACAGKATIQRILAGQALRPERVTYYLERRDPDFEAKMCDVLVVDQEVAAQNQQAQTACPLIVSVSVDEKPGGQAIATTAPDLPPVPGRHASIGRDYEYRRLGTCSILAGLDLHTGRVIARVERRHRSREFIALLRQLDEAYAPGVTLRLILDHHSAHISQETRTYRATRPNRFKFVHTPTHGSWLNLVETLFGKMARSFLRHIRVKSWDELRERLLKGIAEFNAAPVVHRWQKSEPLIG